jgi:hypothetical protein
MYSSNGSSSSSCVLLMLQLPQETGSAAEQSAARMLQLASACVPLPAASHAAAVGGSGRASTIAAVHRNPLADKLSQQVGS